jgi:hypothetical protein
MWAGHKVRRVGAGWRQPFADSKTAAGRRVRVAPASRHVAGRGGVVESSGFILGLAALEEKCGRNVFGGTPNTASGTRALPGIVHARSEPLKTSSNQVNQGQSRSKDHVMTRSGKIARLPQPIREQVEGARKDVFAKRTQTTNRASYSK